MYIWISIFFKSQKSQKFNFVSKLEILKRRWYKKRPISMETFWEIDKKRLILYRNWRNMEFWIWLVVILTKLIKKIGYFTGQFLSYMYCLSRTTNGSISRFQLSSKLKTCLSNKNHFIENKTHFAGKNIIFP